MAANEAEQGDVGFAREFDGWSIDFRPHTPQPEFAVTCRRLASAACARTLDSASQFIAQLFRIGRE